MLILLDTVSTYMPVRHSTQQPTGKSSYLMYKRTLDITEIRLGIMMSLLYQEIM